MAHLKGSMLCSPLSAGSDDPEASLVHIYMLVVLGTLVSTLIIGCLLKR